jgi:NAD(P)-dependent dehydrogenase (short-subunit alcohol dehydrogenase family)
MSPKVALIFGYGPHVGADVAKTFHAQAYQVAIVSRSVQPENSSVQDYLSIQADLSDPSVVEGIFTTVIQKLGHPSVVVYNGTLISLSFSFLCYSFLLPAPIPSVILTNSYNSRQRSQPLQPLHTAQQRDLRLPYRLQRQRFIRVHRSPSRSHLL